MKSESFKHESYNMRFHSGGLTKKPLIDRTFTKSEMIIAVMGSFILGFIVGMAPHWIVFHL